ncbi:MAG: hypothetical protein PHH59_15030 [Methylovulum sp.]|uniref:hypothetical protein n=1 Tax=Methylovulum sp. TaxID=1916980 RepID=UPI00262B90CC|nr:hypothetical protein [Methylovulum sp.]MDD2725318.1 hypothetical protein [Methylovulum sp.]MDD5125897.1 hypothetical protein [Methylovulum sp.]
MDILQKKGWSVSFLADNPNIKYDIVVFNKTHNNRGLEEARRVKDSGAKIIFDLCDNYFYNPHQLPEIDRAQYIILQMMRLADKNVASSEFLAACMAEYIASEQINIIEDAVDELLPLATNLADYWNQLRKYRQLSEKIACWRKEGKICLVWFGIAGGGKADYGIGDLAKIEAILNDPKFRKRITLTAISNDNKRFQDITAKWDIPVAYLPWHTSTFSHAFKLHDISVIPISKNPFTLAKTNNRLALSLRLGLPVIADSIPSYLPFSKTCVLDDWEKGLDVYVNNIEQRFSDVGQGQRLIVENWSTAGISKQWENLFYKVVKQ